MASPSTRAKYGLPPRPFLYTLDQIMDLLGYADMRTLARSVFFDGRSIGAHPKDKILARNISGDSDAPEWRVEEEEFIRWMRQMNVITVTR